MQDGKKRVSSGRTYLLVRAIYSLLANGQGAKSSIGGTKWV